MSRGYGWVERRVLEGLNSASRPNTALTIASWVYRDRLREGVADAHPPKSAEIIAVKRALRSLKLKGERISGVSVFHFGVRRTYWATEDVWETPITEPMAVRARLVKLLGLLGSQFDGERANAAFLAEKLRREIGLSWDDLIADGIDGHTV